MRTAAATMTLGVLVFAGAATAEAHVRAIPESTAAGAFTKITFRVPTESDTASTTKLEIELPTATPLAFVTAQQIDGWAVTVTRTKLAKPVSMEGAMITEAPSKVTWTATKGHEIGPGQFQEFALSGGPLPSGVPHLDFPATQTYSDGKVVAWNQPHPAGGDEPEHPVPSFELTAALPAGAGHGAAAAPSGHSSAGDSNAEGAASDSTARWLGGAGLVAGLAALGLAAASALGRRGPRTVGSDA
jgi:uncharacterized protein YcnI